MFYLYSTNIYNCFIYHILSNEVSTFTEKSNSTEFEFASIQIQLLVLMIRVKLVFALITEMNKFVFILISNYTSTQLPPMWN